MARGNKGGAGTCSDLDALEKKYRDIAKKGRFLFPLSAENLEYWLSKKGGTKTIDSSYFKDDVAVQKHLANSHRAVFLSNKDKNKGVVARIKKDRKVGAEYSMKWEDSMYARFNSELFFALGGFTLISEVKVKVLTIKGSQATVRFTSWVAEAKDVYDWDQGKWVKIPGFGKVDDDDARCLEKAGRAKSFKIKSKSWNVSDKKIAGDAVVDLGTDPSGGIDLEIGN